MKKLQKHYSRQGAVSKMFRYGDANASFSPVDFLKIGKLTSIN